MANRFMRVDLSDKARDFRLVAIEPGKPLLDRSGSRGKLLFRWLGGLAAEPVWEGDYVAFYVRDDYGGRLEDVACCPASRDDLGGQLKEDLEKLRDRLDKARPETPSEQAVRAAVHRTLRELLDDPNRSDLDSYFFRYRDVNGRWRLVWCWGYERVDKEPAPAVICTHPQCNLLFVRRRGQSSNCPACAHVPERKPRRGMPLKTIAALLLVLVIAALGYYGLNRTRQLAVEPQTWSARIGDELSLDSQGPVKVLSKWLLGVREEVTDRVQADPADPQVVRWEAQHRRLTAKAAGKTGVRLQLDDLPPATLAVDVAAPTKLALEPEKLEISQGESVEPKVFGVYDDGKKVDLTEQVRLSTQDSKIAYVDGQQLVGKHKGSTPIKAQYFVPGKDVPLEATGSVTVLPGQLAEKPRDEPKVPPKPDAPEKPGDKPEDQGKPDAAEKPGDEPKVPPKPDPAEKPAAEPKIQGKPDAAEKPGDEAKVPPKPDAPKKPGDKPEDQGKPDAAEKPGDEPKVPPKPDAAEKPAAEPKIQTVRIVSDHGPPVLIPAGVEFSGFRVEAHYQDGKVENVTHRATLRPEEPPDKSPISVQDGRVLAIRPGKTNLSATVDGVKCEAPLEIEVTEQRDFDELRLHPSSCSMRPRESIALEVVALRGGKELGKLRNLSGVALRSDKPEVAEVSGTTVWAIAEGEAQIVATCETPKLESPPAIINVVRPDEPVPTELLVKPQRLQAQVGQNIRVGRDIQVQLQREKAATLDVADYCKVQADQPSVVRYDEQNRVLVAEGPGTANISFRYDEKTAQATIEVADRPAAPPEQIDQIVIEPATDKLAVGQQLLLSVFAITADGRRVERTSDAIFASGDEEVVRMDNNRAVAKKPGKVRITARLPGCDKSATAHITVEDEPITEVFVGPPGKPLKVGQRARMRVYGKSRSGTRELAREDIKLEVPPDKRDSIKINRDGTIEANQPGETELIIRHGDLRTTHKFSVEPAASPQVVGLEIQPHEAVLKPGEPVEFTVKATTQQGTQIELPEAKLESLDQRVLAPDGQQPRRFVAKAPGRTQVRASHGDRQTLADVSVMGKRFMKVDMQYHPGEKQFHVSLNVQAEGGDGDWQYRTYLPGQKPANGWKDATRDGDRLKVELNSPPIAYKQRGELYELIIEARHKKSGAVEEYPQSFWLREVLEPVRQNPPQQ